MKEFAKSLTIAALAATIASPAIAGGIVDAPADPQIIIVPEPDMNWTGAYGALLLGAGSGSYGNGASFPADGEGDWDGTSYGLALGYNFQNGNMVYGAELTYAAADVTGTEVCVNPSYQCAGSLESIASLRARAGYLIQPNTLIYGTLGLVSAEQYFWTDNGAVLGQTRTVGGYLAGVGVEHALSDSMNLRGAVTYYDIDGADYQTDVPYLDVSSDFVQFELGLVLRF